MTERSTDPGAVESRERLLDAAEHLFSRRGLDAPSARAIALAAGHANTAAVSYHFGDRFGLVRAVVERRAAQLDIRRDTLLDELEANPPVEPREAIRALIQPWTELLNTPDGRGWLGLLNQLSHHPVYSPHMTPAFTAAAVRGSVHIVPIAAHLDPRVRRFRARASILSVITALGVQSALREAADPNEVGLTDDEVIPELVGMVLAMLTAP
jgi:AcrR family transcriptional regulator